MLLPRDVAEQASRWGTDLEGETGGSVRNVRQGRVDPIVESQRHV